MAEKTWHVAKQSWRMTIKTFQQKITSYGDLDNGVVWANDTCRGSSEVWANDTCRGSSEVWANDTCRGSSEVWANDTCRGSSEVLQLTETFRHPTLFLAIMLASRAVHIEVSNSLDTDSFIHALRRFIARRGPIQQYQMWQRNKFHRSQVGTWQSLWSNASCRNSKQDASSWHRMDFQSTGSWSYGRSMHGKGNWIIEQSVKSWQPFFMKMENNWMMSLSGPYYVK